MTHPKLATARSGWGGRGYYIPGRVSDELDARGKPKRAIFPSVTTILKSVAKPGIDQWIADQTAAKAVASISYLMRCSEEIGWGFLRFAWSREPELVGSEVRLHHEGVKNDAAELGTNIHEWTEAKIDGTVLEPELMAIESEQMAEQVERWLSQHRIVSHAAEFTLLNADQGHVGTADADWTITCLHDPVWSEVRKRWEFCLDATNPGPYRTLVDLKSSRNTWPEHGMQLAALNSCSIRMREVPEGHEGAQLHEATLDGKKVRSWWIEEDAPTWERAALLHIRPQDLDTQGETIEAFAHLIDMTDDLDLYWQGFKGAFALSEMNYLIKQRETARAKLTETEN